MDAIQGQLQKIRAKLNNIPQLEKAEELTKIPKEFLVLGGGVIALILLFLGIGAGSMCSIIGFLYPAYRSFLAIESDSRADDTQWLIYWVVYAFFSIIEVFTDFLLYWIPFYFPFKLAFLLWAMLPQTNGAKYLYDSFLKDFLKRNESKIDAAIDGAKRQFGSMSSELAAASAEVATKSLQSSSSDKKDE